MTPLSQAVHLADLRSSTLEKIAMNKSVIALAVLGAFAGAAAAQSSVTLYGRADANITYSDRGSILDGNSRTSLYDGGANSGIGGSRFGLRGVEDLGGGLKAFFLLESGFNIDTGGQENANSGSAANPQRLFSRLAYVGLSSSLGEIRLGRQESISRQMNAIGDVSTLGELKTDETVIIGSANRAYQSRDQGNNTRNTTRMASAARIIRVRSSTRCSINVPCRPSPSTGPSSSGAAVSFGSTDLRWKSLGRRVMVKTIETDHRPARSMGLGRRPPPRAGRQRSSGTKWLCAIPIPCWRTACRHVQLTLTPHACSPPNAPLRSCSCAVSRSGPAGRDVQPQQRGAQPGGRLPVRIPPRMAV